jgi:hypothetical protein
MWRVARWLLVAHGAGSLPPGRSGVEGAERSALIHSRARQVPGERRKRAQRSIAASRASGPSAARSTGGPSMAIAAPGAPPCRHSLKAPAGLDGAPERHGGRAGYSGSSPRRRHRHRAAERGGREASPRAGCGGSGAPLVSMCPHYPAISALQAHHTPQIHKRINKIHHGRWIYGQRRAKIWCMK